MAEESRRKQNAAKDRGKGVVRLLLLALKTGNGSESRNEQRPGWSQPEATRCFLRQQYIRRNPNQTQYEQG